MRNPEEIDPDWARYAETVLIFGCESPLELDLRDVLAPEARNEFPNRGLAGSFAVLTAHDPHGRDLSPAENKALQKQLEGELARDGIRFVRVDACSADRKHCECSVAIDVPQQQAIDIAVQYDQMAIFWFDGDAFWLLGGIVQSDPIRLPRTA